MSTDSVTHRLVIKAASQKYEDFVIDNCQPDWTIKQVKEHLKNNYPNNPDVSALRLIYSGKLLLDHLTLKECIRYNSESTSHILHLVQSSSSLSGNASAAKSNNSSTRRSDSSDDEELTPEGSDSSLLDDSSSSSSSSSSNNSPSPPLARPATSSHQQPAADMYRHQQFQTLGPVDQFDHLLNGFTNYYESMNIPVRSNPWFSTYVQHMALYNYMYLNYMSSLTATLTQGINVPSSTQSTNASASRVGQEQQQARVEEVAGAEPEQRNQPQPAPNNNDLNDREDDWLGTLHNIVSFLVLFCIVYYYSSLERFLVIFVIVVALILYHNGWLSLQRRRRVNNARAQQPAENNDAGPAAAANNNDQTAEAPSNGQDNQTPEAVNNNKLRLFFTFILSFFTSLIPERPRGLH